MYGVRSERNLNVKTRSQGPAEKIPEETSRDREDEILDTIILKTNGSSLPKAKDMVKSTSENLGYYDKHSSNELYRQVQKLKWELNSANSTLEILVSDNQKITAQREEYSSRYKAARAELENCKTQLFKVQPPDRATDTDVENAYNELSQKVSDWVAQVFLFFDDLDSEKGIEPGDNTSASTPIEGLGGIHSLNSSHSSVSEYYMHWTIFAFLGKNVFMESRDLVGMSQEARKVFLNIDEGFQSVNSRRGTNETQKKLWFAEAFTAMDDSPAYNVSKMKKCQQLAEGLLKQIRGVFPALKEAKDHCNAFCEEVIVPAVELANLMVKILPGQYTTISRPEDFKFGCLSPFPVSQRLVNIVKDVVSRKVIQENAWSHIDPDLNMGKVVAVIEPGIVRKGGTQKVIRKPVVILELRKLQGMG